MNNITLSMIVKNEENYLRECLESVKDVVDEIVIVDTGSTDRTLEIAKEFSAKIFHFEWVNDFSAARNYALSKSTGDWILYLDADERLSAESIDILKKEVQTSEKLGINCLVKSFDQNDKISQSMRYTRLFKNNPSLKFSGKVHEQIEPSLKENNYKIINSNIEIIHKGYGINKEELKEKAERNLLLLLEDYKTNKSSIISYQIANSYSILNKTTESAKYYKLALTDKHLKKEFKTVCFSRLADFEMRNNNLQEALIFAENGLKIDKNDVLLNIVTSQIFAKKNIADKTLKYCKKALQQSLISNSNSGEKNNQRIYIDSKKIIFEGVLYSLQFNNKEFLNYFLKQLKIVNKNIGEIIYRLLLDKDISREEVDVIESNINLEDIDFYLKIFENLNNVEIKLDFYSNLYNRFPTNSKFLNSFG